MILKHTNALNSLLLLTILLAVVQLTVYAAPAVDITDPELYAGKDEGDMLLTPEQRQLLRSPIAPRNGLISQTKRWPNRIVYYKIIGPEFEQIHRAAILREITTLEEKTCIKFQEANDTKKEYLQITSKPGGCFTAVGYLGRVQEMNLQPFPINEGCFRKGTIIHEFMHALGFYHEQSSAERDHYIDVIYENIVPGKEFNFDPYSPSVVSDFGVGYDYESCLHYGPAAFSVNGEPTIVPKDRSAKIGQRTGMSQLDIDKINVMYKCPLKL